MNDNSDTRAPRRHALILELVETRPVRSQEELRQLLHDRGVLVAQPTLSRDVRQLGLAKTPRGYVPPGAAMAQFAPAAERRVRLERTLRAHAVTVQVAGSLVVVRTPPAAAHPVARAVDEASVPGVVGTLAGDDTVFIATPNERVAQTVARRLTAALGARAAEGKG